MAHEITKEPNNTPSEITNYTEVYKAIKRRMFVISTMSDMAIDELDSHWFTDEQKFKMIAEELDIICEAAEMIKDMFKVTT